MAVEHRSLSVSASSKVDGVIEMRVITYDTQPDDYGTIWRRGCLTAGLNKRLPIILWAHDIVAPIGRGVSWRDSADGPLVTARLDNHPDVPLARQAIAQLQSGTLTDVSLGFSHAVKEEPTSAEFLMWGRSRTKEAIVSAVCEEISIVYRGAVPGAEVLSLRHNSSATTMPATSQRDMALALIDGRMTPGQWRASRVREAELDRRVDNLAASRLAEAERDADEAMALLERRTWR